MGHAMAEVTWEDQQEINAFGRLNNRMHEIAAELKVKQKLLEDLEDASNELMVTDEEEVRYAVGDTFVTLENMAAEERLAGVQEKTNGEVEALQSELDDTRAQMKKLKDTLYGKFGDSINLEEDP